MMRVRKRWKISEVFFFSSRRRHTRLQGDWSSDVCSSDLDLVVKGQDDLDTHPGHQIGNFLREDVGALLVQQAGHTPFSPGLLESRPRILPPAHFGADQTLSYLQLHVADRGVLRQRENVQA